MATLRAATTRHRHTDRISGDTYQPIYLPEPNTYQAKEGREEWEQQSTRKRDEAKRKLCSLTKLEHKTCEVPEDPVYAIQCAWPPERAADHH